MKYCKRCGKDKSLIDFSRDKSKSDGLQSYCKPCINEYNKDYYQENRNDILVYQAEYAANNPEVGRKAAEVWRNKHPELYIQRIDAWRKANPESVRGQANRRRARKQNCDTPLTNSEWLEILEDFNYLCFWCGAPYEEQDHLIPLSKGGTHSKENVVPSCVSCNRKKATKDPLDFLISISS